MAIVYPQFPRLADIGGIVSREFNSGMEMGRESLGVDAFGRYLDVQGRQQASPQLMQAPAAAAPMSLSALGNQAMGAPVQPVERAPLGPIGNPSAGTQPRLPDPATARVQQAHSPRESLIQNESGGRWDARNNATGSGGKKGHFGRVQFGHARLEDAKRAGAIPAGMTPEQFMASPDAQVAAEQWHFSDIDRQAQAKGLTAYMGQNIGGVTITPDAIRAMAHLGGIGGAERFIKSGGRYNPADENGTRLSDYGQRHGAPTSQAALESMSVGQQMPAQGQQFAQMGSGGFPMPQGQQPVQLPPREVMMDLFRSPATRQLAINLAQAAQSGQQIEQYQTFQREDGSIWQMNTQTGQMQILQKSPTADGGTEYGLAPQYGVDAQGNPVIIQLAKDGTSRQTPLPDGVSLSREPIRLDAGTHHVLLDPVTRQQVGIIPKENREAAYETGYGGAEGKAAAERAAGLPQAEQNAQEILTVLDTLENHPGMSTAVGWQGNIPDWAIPAGTDAAGFMSVLNQIGGQAFLQAFESLKGGGQITEIEGQKATQAITRLNRSLSEVEFKRAIREFREVINAGLERARRGVRADGAPMQAAPAQTGNRTSSGVPWSIEE